MKTDVGEASMKICDNPTRFLDENRCVREIDENPW